MKSVARPSGRPTPIYRFFAGKGGVGKTTCAAAAALAAAEAGHRVLAVSTDPAHSLGDALGRRLGAEPIELPIERGVLWAAEIAAERALERWLGPRRGGFAAAIERGTYLDGADAARLLALTPPGVDELAAILELPRLAATTGCDEVVVDTAPTAHTLRLVAVPAALERLAAFLDGLQERDRALAAHFGAREPGARQPGAAAERAEGAIADLADGAIADLAAAAAEVGALLGDPARAAFVWVLLPEALTVAETLDGVAALERAGIEVRELVVNRMTPPARAAPLACPGCAARRAAELAAVAELRRALPGRPLRFLPALAREPRGRAALRSFGRALAAPDGGAWLAAAPAPLPVSAPSPRRSASRADRSKPPAWLRRLAPPGLRLLLFGGKGGVGKTTCAAAVALLAAADRPVLLLSTDPAHSLGDALDVPLDDSPRAVPGAPRLRARELDAERAFAAWRERLGGAGDELLGTLAGAPAGTGSDLAALAPAGMDELVALATLLDAVGESDDAGDPHPRGPLIVVDTAPTGHALRLLALPELALAWDHALLGLLLKYRAAAPPGPLAAELVELARSLRRFRALLADPARARFVAVTRAGELPRRETARLLAALEALGIAPAAILANALPAPRPARSNRARADRVGRAGFCPRCASEAAAAERELVALARLAGSGSARPVEAAVRRPALISAPLEIPPPRGAAALRAWARSWRIEGR